MGNGAAWRQSRPAHDVFRIPLSPTRCTPPPATVGSMALPRWWSRTPGVFRSDDAGATWTYAWKGITPRYSRPMCVDPRAPYGLTVASAPTAFSNHREEGGSRAMLFRSEDGGEAWRSMCDEAHLAECRQLPRPDGGPRGSRRRLGRHRHRRSVARVRWRGMAALRRRDAGGAVARGSCIEPQLHRKEPDTPLTQSTSASRLRFRRGDRRATALARSATLSLCASPVPALRTTP